MKKVITFVMIMLMIPCVAFAEATERRGAVEFCELYMNRLTSFQQEAGLGYDVVISSFVAPYEIDGKIVLESTAGSMKVYTDDFTVSDIIMTLADESAADEKNEWNVYNCMASFSALEFDYDDDVLFSLKSKIGNSSASAMYEAARIWDEEFCPILTDSLFEQVSNSKERIKVYSGNYDYYLTYFAGTLDGKTYGYYYLIGEEHK